MKALLAIKPEFVKKIFSGVKKYEYRKVIFTKKVAKVIIYASSPVSKVVGEFTIDSIVKGKPNKVWEEAVLANMIYSNATTKYMCKYYKINATLVLDKLQEYKNLLKDNLS